MIQLCIVVEEPLRCERLHSSLTDFISVRGSVYKKRPEPDDAVVFYDWIIDDADCVRGLEIHLPPSHRLLQSDTPLNSISFIEIDCFVRIWFGKDRVGEAQGMEAFGDISFFGTDMNELAVVVGLDAWLSVSQRNSLLTSLCFAAS